MLFSCYFSYCGCTDVGVPRADLASNRAPVEDAAGVHQPEGAECARVVGGCTPTPADCVFPEEEGWHGTDSPWQRQEQGVIPTTAAQPTQSWSLQLAIS